MPNRNHTLITHLWAFNPYADCLGLFLARSTHGYRPDNSRAWCHVLRGARETSRHLDSTGVRLPNPKL